MDDSVHEALAFNREIQRKPRGWRKTALNALAAVVLAGGYFIISQWGKDISPWVFVGFFVAWMAVLFWIGTHQSDVRPSYRQDPFNQPKPDKMFYTSSIAFFAPVFFPNFLEGHLVIAAIVFTLWGCAVFWVLNSGAMDLSTRDQGNDKQASGDE